MDKLNYIYQSGIICDRTGADFSLSEKIVGYALSESDFYIIAKTKSTFLQNEKYIFQDFQPFPTRLFDNRLIAA